MNITVENVTLRYGRKTVVDDVSFNVPTGEFLAIIGPNGSGKSTLLRGMSRVQVPSAGRVLLGEHDVHRMPSRQLARILAFLPQSPGAGADVTVNELVWRGRYPHQGILQRATRADYEAISWALNATGITALASRPLAQISGGERQRAWIAMALAQKPAVLLLDEPTSFLDIRHQLEVMELLRTLNAEGLTVVAVLHDLLLASRYASRILAMRDGRAIALGAPSEVLTPSVMRDVFEIEVAEVHDPETSRPVLLPRLPRT